jgi:polysaccharide export outer membrane protein
VRKAWSIGNPDLLGSWLYGVAYRVARKARAQRASRREHERLTEPMVTGDPLDAVSWKEVQATLDEELHRLPEKYRQPLILCYLQGMTNEEAARRLGWPAGSMSYRLARGREMLRDRMDGRRHGTAPSSFALMLAIGGGGARLPSELVSATVQSAVHLGTGSALAGTEISSFVGSLVEGTLRGMAPAWRKRWATMVLAVVAALAVGTAAVIAWQGLGMASGNPNGSQAGENGSQSGGHCGHP